MGWEFQCPDEWYVPLLALTKILEFHNQHNPASAVHATQVKSRFGELRFYADHGVDDEHDFPTVIIHEF